jgi:hypothetical protein
MTQFQPLPEVAYHIQNVKSESYLQVSDNGNAAVHGREDNSLAQQWKFIPTAKDTYQIVNVASNQDDITSHLALGLDPNFVGLVVGTDLDKTSTAWKISISADRGHCSYVNMLLAIFQSQPLAGSSHRARIKPCLKTT